MTRILGTLHTTNEAGVVRLEERYDTDINDLWSSLTEPDRLARWYGTVHGDLRQGGTFALFVDHSEWDGSGQIELCEPPHRLVVRTKQSDASWSDGETPYDEVIDATLTADGDHTVLGLEVRGLPLDKIAYYGAGWQQNVETLTAYLADRPLPGEELFKALVPSYLEQAAQLQ